MIEGRGCTTLVILGWVRKGGTLSPGCYLINGWLSKERLTRWSGVGKEGCRRRSGIGRGKGLYNSVKGVRQLREEGRGGGAGGAGGGQSVPKQSPIGG